MTDNKKTLEIETDSGLVSFAKKEIEIAKGLGYDGMIDESVLDILGLMGSQGHSGGSMFMTLAALEKLARFQPLTPLTGADDEWMEVTDGTFQNVRCPTVFKENGRAYDIDVEGRPTINFPYQPGGPSGGTEVTGDEVSRLAGAYMHMTPAKLEQVVANEEGQEQLAADIRSMAASLLTQDETKGDADA